MELNDAVIALAALAQGSRLGIFRLLVQQGVEGMVVGKIAEATHLAPATLSFHLKELSRAGLLLSRPHGRYIIYSANFEAMNTLIDFLTENCCQGEPCTPFCIPEAVQNNATRLAINQGKNNR